MWRRLFLEQNQVQSNPWNQELCPNMDQSPHPRQSRTCHPHVVIISRHCHKRPAIDVPKPCYRIYHWVWYALIKGTVQGSNNATMEAPSIKIKGRLLLKTVGLAIHFLAGRWTPVVRSTVQWSVILWRTNTCCMKCRCCRYLKGVDIFGLPPQRAVPGAT